MEILILLGPAVLGALLLWFANKCKGKNAKDCSRLAGWGFLLLYARFLAALLPIPFLIGWLLLLGPSAICFLMSFNAIVKEMRAQKNGEFTEAA